MINPQEELRKNKKKNRDKVPTEMQKAEIVFEKIASTIKQIQEAAKNPSLEALGEIDFEQLHDRDKDFFNHILTMAEVDSEIIKRVIIMRHKINNNIRLTQAEAEELVTVLQCKGFYLTGLDLSDYEFGTLDLGDAYVGGDFNTEGTSVRSNNFQSYMIVKGSNFQEGMKIGGFNDQSGMEIHGNNHQEYMEVEGDNLQAEMKINGENYQKNMTIGRANIQSDMWVFGENDNRPKKYTDGGWDEEEMQPCL
jgi:hypothetical protein